MKQSRTSSLSRPLDPVLIHPVLPCWIGWLLFLCGGSIGKAICSTAGWQYATVSDHVKWHHLHKTSNPSGSKQFSQGSHRMPDF
ncbi:uncharacterized protein LOC135100723 isoform X1 [Scylla paramamosain]|uniref:uncharacterized protein LOC135100723 isoform X1 n=1 Tax=Scylla paramamosain TaxID=85552 RepID=UPI003083579A